MAWMFNSVILAGSAGVGGVWGGLLLVLAAARTFRILMSFLRSSAWGTSRASVLKPWLAIVGSGDSDHSGGLSVTLGRTLHRPGG